MLMSALFVAGAFAVSGNVAKADAVQANNSNNVNSTEVKQNNTMLVLIKLLLKPQVKKN